MNLIEDVVVGALLVFFIGLLSLIAVVSNLWPLWVAVALLVWALLVLVGVV